LLLISVIANVDLYRKQNPNKTTPAEANGTYELLISNLNGVNLALNSYLTAGNSADKTLAMFQLIRQTDRAYMDVYDLNRQLADVYEGDLYRLEEVVFSLTLDAIDIAEQSRENDVTLQVRRVQTQVQSLLDSLNHTTLAYRMKHAAPRR